MTSGENRNPRPWTKRTKVLPVRISEEEWQHAKRTAKFQGCASVSALVRLLLSRARTLGLPSRN